MIVNPDIVDVYTSLKQRKHPKTQVKQQPTENQQMLKSKCQLQGHSFYILFARVAAGPLHPVSYVTD